MNVRFVPGTIYKVESFSKTHMPLGNNVIVDLRKTVFLCLGKAKYSGIYSFLCADEHGMPHEFVMAEGSVMGNLCKEMTT